MGFIDLHLERLNAFQLADMPELVRHRIVTNMDERVTKLERHRLRSHKEIVSHVVIKHAHRPLLQIIKLPHNHPFNLFTARTPLGNRTIRFLILRSTSVLFFSQTFLPRPQLLPNPRRPTLVLLRNIASHRNPLSYPLQIVHRSSRRIDQHVKHAHPLNHTLIFQNDGTGLTQLFGHSRTFRQIRPHSRPRKRRSRRFAHSRVKLGVIPLLLKHAVIDLPRHI